MALIADLRGIRQSLGVRLRQLAWHPSVLAVLADDAAELADAPPSLVLGCAVTATLPAAGDVIPKWAHVIAVELSAGERPPARLAHCGKPVIAVRRGASYADVHEARAACDRLQADLAPQFDLAGYFVAP